MGRFLSAGLPDLCWSIVNMVQSQVVTPNPRPLPPAEAKSGDAENTLLKTDRWGVEGGCGQGQTWN